MIGRGSARPAPANWRDLGRIGSCIEDAPRWRVAGAAMALCAVAVLPTIGRQPLSWNEAVTLGAAQRSPTELWAMLRHTDAPLGFYYLITHYWTSSLHAIGIETTAAWLRLPSALAAIGAVGLLVQLVSRWFDQRIGLLAGTLLALHPLLTFYAQDARPYALVTAAYLGSTWALLRALDQPSPPRYATYSLLAVATIYLHLFAIYAFAAHAIVVARTQRVREPWLWVAVSVAAAITPLLVLSHGESGELGWISKPTVAGITSVVANLFGGVALLLVMIAQCFFAIRHHLVRPDPRIAFLAGVVAVPVIALIVVDFFVPDLVARYGLVTVPATVTLMAVIGLRSPRRLGRVLVILGLGAALVTTVVQESRSYKYEDYRSAVDLMGDLASPGDAVMFLPINTRAGFEPYRDMEPDLDNVTDPAASRAPAQSDQIGGLDLAPPAIGARFADAPTIFVMGDTLATAQRVLHDGTDLAELGALHGYQPVRVARYGDLYLTVLRRVP